MWSHRFTSLVLAVLAFLSCSNISGQSGRRPLKPGSTTTPTERTKSADTAPPEVPGSTITVLVGRQPTSRHLLSEDTIYSAFIERLSQQRNVAAVPIGDIKKRDDAVKRAKSETERYVVLLQLEIDNFQQGTIVLNSPDLEVKYIVLAPVTGQQKFKGKVYYQAIGGARARKDAWPNGPPIKITPEAAAIAAADGLYDWLLLSAGIRQR
ncbi:MAG: hypothetical protein C5B44_00420 [Acidobacteria bacterium]|nr:MAG: hypothetical protein C5B44_00420 [Acidobacteriota bacterium]